MGATRNVPALTASKTIKTPTLKRVKKKEGVVVGAAARKTKKGYPKLRVAMRKQVIVVTRITKQNDRLLRLKNVMIEKMLSTATKMTV